MDYSKVNDFENITAALEYIDSAIKFLEKVKHSEQYNLADYRVALENIRIDLESELEGE